MYMPEKIHSDGKQEDSKFEVYLCKRHEVAVAPSTREEEFVGP